MKLINRHLPSIWPVIVCALIPIWTARCQTILFSDDFSSGIIDTNKWTTSGFSIGETPGVMHVETDATDNGGVLASVPVPMSPAGDVTVSRDVFVHYANDNYVGYIEIRFGGLSWAAVNYANATWSDDLWLPRYGTYIGRTIGPSDNSPGGAWVHEIARSSVADTSDSFPVLWDTWFNEKIVYSPTTGILQYFVNETNVTDYFIGVMPATNNQTIQFGFQAWGWYTGHEELFDSFLVTQDITSPLIVTQPQSQTAQNGASAALSVTAEGPQPLSYQWEFSGRNIPNASNATLTLNSVTSASSGAYSVIVSNPYGSATSETAYLSVLADGANGNTPTQIVATSVPSKPDSARNLLLVTHGWQWTFLNPLGPPSQPWMVDMTNDIIQQLEANGQAGTWQVEAYYWLSDAWTASPDTALANAKIIGAQLGKELAAQGYQKVHLIAHSAGAGLIQAITDQLKTAPNPPVVQETFLDPFTGQFLQGRQEYGLGANWADDYFVVDFDTDDAGLLLLLESGV